MVIGELTARHVEAFERYREKRLARLAKLEAIPLEDCHEKYRELPPSQHDIPDDELPFKDMAELMFSEERYCGIFESPSNTTHPQPPFIMDSGSLGRPAFVPWIIEAPLNSVEILEALLKPAHPFEIHTARHVQRRCSPKAKKGTRNRRMYDEYIRLQGQLELDRQISYILVPRDAVGRIHTITFGVYNHVILNYISIPWGKGWACPWALVLHDKPSPPGTLHTYENRLERFLDILQLSEDDRKFRRSLLPHGSTPIPECSIDWFAGRPGKSAGLPYFASAEELQTNRQDAANAVQRTHNGQSYFLASCCLPTLDHEAAHKQWVRNFKEGSWRINKKDKPTGQNGCRKDSVSDIRTARRRSRESRLGESREKAARGRQKQGRSTVGPK